jgi:localization factor PodJL
MKSGGPWNFAGLRPQAREAERRPSASVGDWLNSVIKTDSEENLADDALPPRSPPRLKQQRDDRPERETKPIRYEGRPYRDEHRGEDAAPRHHDTEDRPHREPDRDDPREPIGEPARSDYTPSEQWRSDAVTSDAARQAAVRKVEDAAREAAREAEEARRLEAVREAAREEARREAAIRDAEEARRRDALREAEEARRLEVAREAAREEARREAAIRDAEEARRRDALREAEEARLEATREVAREESRREAAMRDAEEARRRDAAREEARREAAHAREGLGEMHSRLDKLTAQIDRLARIGGVRQRAAAVQIAPAEERKPRLAGAPQRRRATPPEPVISIEDAVAEIAARQRALDNQAAAPVPAPNSGQAIDRDAAAPAGAVIPAPVLAPGAAELTAVKPDPPLGHEPAAPVAAAASRPVFAEVATGLGAARPYDPLPDARAHMPSPASAPGPAVDFSGLEKQLREIMSRIEALQPANDIEKVIAAIRTDLAEIGRQLNDALPRRAVESLEIEIRALAERIDHSRQSGVDPNALAGLERGLAEVHEAVRALTPAENLVGFNEAVNALSQKVDIILAKDDPSALQQLETAIGGLRGVVSHVASNDTLTRVAEDVRALAAQIDGIANSAATGHAVSALEQRIDTLAAALTASSEAGQSATGHAVSALEQRIDTLAAALTASSEAGQSVPRDLEKLLAGLIEKLEWVQLTHTDHAALAHLEDRIATLVQRFDASDARLSHLEAIERGLADLLVHIEEIRGVNSGAGALFAQPAARAIERDVAEIRESERRTQESLEAVQGTVEHVVNRLATIETGLHADATPQASPESAPAAAPPVPAPEGEAAVAEPEVAPPLAPEPAAVEPTPRVSSPRAPIDPTLPPDHPLEPRSTANRSRPGASAAERIAASEAAVGSVKPPVIADAERPDFIAAARRAAQAAAWEQSGQNAKVPSGADPAAQPNRLSQRLRKLIVAGSVLLILVGCLRIATKLFEDSGSASVSPAQSEQTPPPVGPPQSILPPNPPEEAPTQPPEAVPSEPPKQPPAAKAAKPQRQSTLPGNGNESVTAAGTAPAADQPGGAGLPAWAVPDVTGALPRPEGVPGIATSDYAAQIVEEKLPATIGDPALRAAAMAGDPAAAYEVGTRFAEGRGVPQNNEEAARWLRRAADKGLAPAQFRLGGLYEKGIGVKKDLAAARDLYLAAAAKGNGKAMHNLAVLYAEGAGGAPDYNKAAEWFRKAADRGIRDSQYNLGILYARGIGVEKNDAESYKWFALAANQGDREAAKKRDEIVTHLDPQSLAAAKAAVQNWTPQPQPDDAINVKTAAAWSSTAKASRSSKQK